MRVGIFTREYPPHVYGGAGVHVEYLSRELAKKIEVEVHCWGDQNLHQGNLHVRGEEPWEALARGTPEKFDAALSAFSLNLLQMKSLANIDIIHTHTWYVSMAGFLAKKLFKIPFVLTTHSLEPLRAWKAEQLGSGYAMSSWMERTAILDADAVIAVSKGTKADILRVYPELHPERIHVIYNGIDLAEYHKTSDTRRATSTVSILRVPYVLFVGRITRQKGVTHLVEAIRYLPPIPRWFCVPARRTRLKSPPRCARKCDAAHGHPHVVWIEKMVTKAEVIQLYSHCSRFLLSLCL